MSQQKVDKYKQDKANRSQIMKKQKRAFKIEVLAIGLVVVGLLGWFGHSYYDRVESLKPPVEYPVDSGAVDDYMSELNAPVEEATDDVAEEEQ